MGNARRWEDVKAEAHQLHPDLDDPARRAAARAELDAHVAGYHLKELRKSLGRTQAEVAAARLGPLAYRLGPDPICFPPPGVFCGCQTPALRRCTCPGCRATG